METGDISIRLDPHSSVWNHWTRRRSGLGVHAWGTQTLVVEMAPYHHEHYIVRCSIVEKYSLCPSGYVLFS